MHPDRITIPADGNEIDTSVEIPVEGLDLPNDTASLEVVTGPLTAPYGTLVVNIGGNVRTYTNIPPGWEHAGQFQKILPGTTVTRVRWWK